MSFIYVLITQNKNLLFDYSPFDGNFKEICLKFIYHINTENKGSYAYDQYLLHVLVDQETVFLCMVALSVSRGLAFAFLEKIKKEFNQVFKQEKPPTKHQKQNFFHFLKTEFDEFSSIKNVDTFTKMKNDLDETKHIMKKNIDKIIDRENKLDDLIDKTENLGKYAANFKKTSRNVKRRMCWEKYKTTIVLLLVITVFIYFVAAGICGGFHFPKCHSQK
ncbi:vesicle-associated membrane protein [Anaeramoeba ignava]|uniref:Vesicle-associated membrane protein n=1 Tax=Anaeramoeba ignava TaxID=1746090 RepID=A0A9Q0LI15_ANAIG|nr:vesicle-associated membrane protein [Anaeramoeba ignava]